MYQIANLCSKGFKGTCCYATSKNLMSYIKVSFSLPATLPTRTYVVCMCLHIYKGVQAMLGALCTHTHTTAAWHNRVKKHLMLRRLMLLCLCLYALTRWCTVPALIITCALGWVSNCPNDTHHPLHKKRKGFCYFLCCFCFDFSSLLAQSTEDRM